MTARVLEPQEWDRLAADVQPILAALNPDTARALVVEDDDGAIIGRWLLFPVLHAECVWIAPEARRAGGVARRLLRLLRTTAQGLGFRRVWTASDSEIVTRLLAHPGMRATPIPALNFVLNVEPSCPTPLRFSTQEPMPLVPASPLGHRKQEAV